MTIDELVSFGKGVQSREALAEFIRMLSELYKTERSQFVNRELGSYLEAMSGWVEDMDGYYKNNNVAFDGESASWRIFADILLAASMYE